MVQLAWTPERAGGVHAPQRVRAQLDGESVEVLPLWVAVHQQHDGAVARCLCLRGSKQTSARSAAGSRAYCVAFTPKQAAILSICNPVSSWRWRSCLLSSGEGTSGH